MPRLSFKNGMKFTKLDAKYKNLAKSFAKDVRLALGQAAPKIRAYLKKKTGAMYPEMDASGHFRTHWGTSMARSKITVFNSAKMSEAYPMAGPRADDEYSAHTEAGAKSGVFPPYAPIAAWAIVKGLIPGVGTFNTMVWKIRKALMDRGPANGPYPVSTKRQVRAQITKIINMAVRARLKKHLP